jgi:hypothetical protein
VPPVKLVQLVHKAQGDSQEIKVQLVQLVQPVEEQLVHADQPVKRELPALLGKGSELLDFLIHWVIS